MKRSRKAAALVAAVLAAPLTGCERDPSAVTASELLGLWAAVEMVYTSREDPTVEADLIADGATYSIELRSDRTFSSLLSGWLHGSVEEDGTYAVTDGRLLLEPAGGAARTLDLDFNQSLLTVHEAEARWDFDDDGAPDPATLHMVLDRF